VSPVPALSAAIRATISRPRPIPRYSPQQFIGLEEIDDGIWSIYFNTVLLAQIDEREMRIHG
jgi:hypothetical protein